MEHVLHFLAAVVLGLTVVGVRVLVASRRRAAVRHGEATIVPARLARGSERPRAGSLVLSTQLVCWFARRGSDQVDLAGGEVLSAAPATGFNARELEDVVRLGLPDGSAVTVRLFTEDAATLVESLRRGPRPSGGPSSLRKPPRSGAWAVASLVLGVAFIAVYVAMALSSDAAVATVTDGDGEGTCQVTWTSAGGHPDTGEVDCLDETVGSTRTVWVLSDEPGDVVDPGHLTAGMVGLGLVLGLPGGVRWLVVRRRRRTWLLAGGHAAATPLSPAPPLF
ncbi:hypothetical protein [Geodermatophilus sp. URMC 64]